MTKGKCSIRLIIVLVLMFSSRVFSQQVNYNDSLSIYNPGPRMNYSLGSTVTVIPHYGTVTGITFSPYLSVPVSPKLSLDGGIIAGRYYSTIPNINSEGTNYGTFNEISIYGSASYHINPQLTLYGAGIKQLGNTSPYNFLPKSSYTIGSTYKFGNFSVGASIQMSKWDNYFSPIPFNNPMETRFPFER